MSLRILVLGAAAGGGLPQWNCGCRNCVAAREGDLPSLSQSSIAVSGDGEHWAIINASPDLRQQLAATPALHATGLRQTPIVSVLVTNGDIDHVAGLLTLREKQPFRLLATSEVHAVLAANPLFQALDPTLVAREAVAIGETVELAPGLRATLFPVPGKVPLYLEAGEVVTDQEGEFTVGVEFASTDARGFYIPGCARMTPALAARLQGAALVLFDGTLYRDDEMITAGLGAKTGRRMGHMPIGGPDGSLAAFAELDVGRKVYVHLNNSNPVLDPRTPERAVVTAAGWTVAGDGMEIRA
ncbi:pyrroloquinoline quinone biosynthesis protein B [Amaricoccus macauensis]|uniref:Coenzyme PQQ synthesis protein B n=1 Tax=Amaricoccus macauensis TaxID=57001 RepID=A0A840SXI4_9RHOB|nr:pyrroloquinoline quinone biosynthesis protein PqqB [Amaricoccus macauensis]MBB5223792.1 pyrroloquinoline quinone biosynthesis protein B [Amaricoccus macauensis]